MNACESFFVGNVPSGLDNCHALLVLILNILCAGLGTFLAGLLFLKESSGNIMLWGLLQFITWIILLGWIWSVWWGIVCFMRREGGNYQKQTDEEAQPMTKTS